MLKLDLLKGSRGLGHCSGSGQDSELGTQLDLGISCITFRCALGQSLLVKHRGCGGVAQCADPYQVSFLLSPERIQIHFLASLKISELQAVLVHDVPFALVALQGSNCWPYSDQCTCRNKAVDA